MGKQLLNITGISTSNLQSNTFALILGIDNTKKRIPIIIGAYEAQAIAIELEGMNPSRPLTHDLLKNIISAYKIEVVEVCINKFHEGVFYAVITLFNGEKKIEIDARTSDAVAIAVRHKCPIYAVDEVVEATSMEEELDLTNVEDELEQEMEAEQSIEELEAYLQELIQQENYEEASKIRDEINKRKSE